MFWIRQEVWHTSVRTICAPVFLCRVERKYEVYLPRACSRDIVPILGIGKAHCEHDGADYDRLLFTGQRLGGITMTTAVLLFAQNSNSTTATRTAFTHLITASLARIPVGIDLCPSDTLRPPCNGTPSNLSFPRRFPAQCAGTFGPQRQRAYRNDRFSARRVA